MVKVLYIESILKNNNIRLSDNEIKKLPKEIFLAYSIQYKPAAEYVKKQLESNGIKIIGFNQVLGCSKIITKSPILLVGSGRFHAQNLYLQAPSVYITEGNKINNISQKEIDLMKVRKNAAVSKFLNAENIGIIVCVKPGQENLKSAVLLKDQLIKKGKKAYIFASDIIDLNQFENFNICSWVNTSCPGLAYDSPSIINIDEASKFL
jgi:diphthamide biosynthesis enzyme Dph1/Dph2-like protein